MTTPATLKVTTDSNTNETRIDQLNNKLKTFQQMLVQDADDLKHKNSDGDIREPKDNPKVYINSLRDIGTGSIKQWNGRRNLKSYRAAADKTRFYEHWILCPIHMGEV